MTDGANRHDQVLSTDPAIRTSDLVARRIKALRQTAGWTLNRLAAACAEAGFPELSRSVIANIESGRRDARGRRTRDVTVDELVAIASALETYAGGLLGIDSRIAPIGPVVVRQLRSLADAIEETSQP